MSRPVLKKTHSYLSLRAFRPVGEKRGNLWRMPELYSKKLRDCFVASLLAMTILALPFAIKADVIDQLGSQISDLQKKWQVLEDQRAEIEKSLKQQKSAAANLENQIALFDNEIKFTETKIAQTQTKLEQVMLEIKSFDEQISGKEKNIIQQKKVLAGFFREVFSADNEDLLDILLANNSLSEFLDASSALEQVQGKINVSLKDLKNSKESLEWGRKQKLAKKQEYDVLKVNLIRETEELNLGMDSKKSLLTVTKGEQSRYEKLLKGIENQREEILGNIAELQKQKAKELAKIKAQQLLPPPNPVAELWHYFQTDPRWGDSFIGFSNSTMKDYGCAVGALAMIFKYHNVDITPGQLARQPIFYYDLIKWPQTWRGINQVVNTGHIQSINWQKVDAYIEDGHPVIVFVKAVGKNGGHYVVVFAKDSRGYIVNDPMWGANIYLDSTRQNIATLYDTTTVVDQMIVYK
jgi:peptidoglycan hydrolase CwlO-like protein